MDTYVIMYLQRYSFFAFEASISPFFILLVLVN